MEAVEWANAHVEPTGALEVASEYPWATVWRVPVGDEVVWLKACRPIQAFEPRMTAQLYERWPDRVPEVIAHDEEHAFLLLRDAGMPIRELGDDTPAIWLDMVRKYAELQHGEAAFADDHLAHGVPDQRLATLPALYEDMCSRELPGDVARLRAFAPRFAELCEELAAHGIPGTVQHDDLHHDNVYARDGHARILDWGDSSIGHPFFSIVVPFWTVEDPAERIALRDALLEPWGASVETFDLAYRLGRIAHVFTWIRVRDVVPPEGLPEFDQWFPGVVADAVAQTIE